MRKKTMTPEEIRTRGLEALAEALGPDGMIRFLQQFGVGSGDYSSERHAWLDKLTLADVRTKLDEKKSLRSGKRARA